MDLRKIKIADLVPATYNPRKALKPGDKEYEKIKRSIEEFGYCEPVIVNSDMTIIGGHQRVTVLKDLGYSEIDCIVIDIDKTKERALNIALNKITGEWNKELLADLIAELQDSDFDVTFTGFGKLTCGCSVSTGSSAATARCRKPTICCWPGDRPIWCCPIRLTMWITKVLPGRSKMIKWQRSSLKSSSLPHMSIWSRT